MPMPMHAAVVGRRPPGQGQVARAASARSLCRPATSHRLHAARCTLHALLDLDLYHHMDGHGLAAANQAPRPTQHNCRYTLYHTIPYSTQTLLLVFRRCPAVLARLPAAPPVLPCLLLAAAARRDPHYLFTALPPPPTLSRLAPRRLALATKLKPLPQNPRVPVASSPSSAVCCPLRTQAPHAPPPYR